MRRPQPNYRRAVNRRAERPTILIVCEGEKTEPLYFREFRVTSAKIEVVGTGYNTLTLVDKARALADQDEFEQVWCVFDKDSFPANDFQAAIDRARKHGFRAAYTNEAFELWFLLHYDYHTSALSRSQYADKLADRLGRKYEKNDPTLFRILLTRQDDAIRNAETLLTTYNPHAPHANNPCTTVHLLVQELRKHSRV